MKKALYLLFAFPALLLFTGCPYYHGYKYDTGKLPTDPVNYSQLNSPYDDYNMSSPVIENNRYLYFSSNRNSAGDQFDIVGRNARIEWSKDEGELTVDDETYQNRDMRYVDTLFRRMNTVYNELGPYSLPYYVFKDNIYNYNDLVVFSNDESGHLDLKLVCFRGTGENPAPYNGSYIGPVGVKGLNSGANDAYLTFYGPGFINNDYTSSGSITEAYFCSDRGGNFDIYTVEVNKDKDIVDFLLEDSVLTVTKAESLSSESQDKCPYIDGDLMVFASDRPGGFGGFDLYYSLRNGDTWSEPVNFGSKINSEYDEYRPILIYMWEFTEDMMLFSSNRPGGQGGFDLYYVGISKMME